jgi:hypothetical protein
VEAFETAAEQRSSAPVGAFAIVSRQSFSVLSDAPAIVLKQHFSAPAQVAQFAVE